MISGGREREAERDEPAEPERRRSHVQEVDERLVPRPAAIERMAGERRHRQQRKSGGERQRLEPGVDRRNCGKHRPHSGDHRRGRHDAAEASRNRDVVDDAGHADEDDQESSEQQPDRHRPDGEAEESRAGRRQQAREEEKAGEDVLDTRSVVCRQGGHRRRASRADPERHHPGERVPVVGEHAPQDGVVAVRQARLERNDEPVADHSRLPSEDGSTSVPDRLDARGGPHGVVEEDLDRGRRRGQHRPVRRNGPEQRGVTPGLPRQGQGDERHDEEGQAVGQRFKKPSEAHC